MSSFLPSGTLRRNSVEELESNALRRRRAVLLLGRPLKFVGTMADLYITARSFPQESVMHWAIGVGPFLHEAHTDDSGKNMLDRHNLYGTQRWPNQKKITLGILGHVDFTDVEIAR
jgi:hypothetical protein